MKVLYFYCFAVLCLVCGCKTTGGSQQQTESGQKPVNIGFVADSAYAYCQAQCDFGPRTMNSEAHERCAEWIKQKFEGFKCLSFATNDASGGLRSEAQLEIVVLAGQNSAVRPISEQFGHLIQGLLGQILVFLFGHHWDSPYAHYQYEGVVYAPNKAVWNYNNIVGWRTPKGVEKYPTDRTLGTPGYLNGWTFGYTTFGTTHHWDKEMMKDRNARRAMNIRITAYLKRMAREKNL